MSHANGSAIGANNLGCALEPVGRKNDQGKRRFDLIPGGALRDVVDVLGFGARTYDAWNWLHVPDWRLRYFNALNRHVDAWWTDGEWLDPDSGLPHLAHATVNAMFLLTLGRPEKAVGVLP